MTIKPSMAHNIRPISSIFKSQKRIHPYLLDYSNVYMFEFKFTLKSKAVEPAKEASGAVPWWMCVVGGGEEDKEGGALEGLKRHQRWMASGSMAVLVRGTRLNADHKYEDEMEFFNG
ncbi:hypothetical protein QVD17_03456 [Tagetes erecta]|uniref:Uncharacterized protein n=1 Tax=Tagetes erecta TaxID=13708 RepID=A0AAD8L8D5_TARER|nr:hypothetical protein QVD17_03456 [Tagetes erecta]